MFSEVIVLPLRLGVLCCLLPPYDLNRETMLPLISTPWQTATFSSRFDHCIVIQFAMHNSKNRLLFCSSDYHFVSSMIPFLMEPREKSLSLCCFTSNNIQTCIVSISSLNFVDLIYHCMDWNMYFSSPPIDACNNSGGIIADGPWCMSDSGMYFLVKAFFIGCLESCLYLRSPTALLSCISLFASLISFIVA